MGMAIDSKKIIERLNKTELKKNYTIALTPSLMESFKGECDRLKVKYSPVLEELIKEFLDSSKPKKK
jgi:hypothetical protein